MLPRLIDGRELSAQFARENIQPQSREHRWRMIRANNFPKPLRIGAKNYWDEAEIEAWKANRIATALAARDGRRSTIDIPAPQPAAA